MSKLTTDEWAEKHEALFKNIDMSFKMFVAKWLPKNPDSFVQVKIADDLQEFRRHLAIFMRQEFDL